MNLYGATIAGKKRLRPLDILRALRDSSEIAEPNELAVLYALVLRADNETGECYPSIATLARYTRLSQATVKRTLHALKDRGRVTIEDRRRFNKTNLYRVVLVGLTVSPAPGSIGAEARLTVSPSLNSW